MQTFGKPTQPQDLITKQYFDSNICGGVDI